MIVGVPGWTCPRCQRLFRRSGQAHECAPAMSLEDYFSTGPERERPIFEAVMAHLDTVGEVHVEPLSVGIYLKRAQTFATLTPMTKWVALSFSLPYVATGPQLSRKVATYGPRHYHTVNLHSPADLDAQVLTWLTESYFSSPE